MGNFPTWEWDCVGLMGILDRIDRNTRSRRTLPWPNVVAKALAAHMAEFSPNTLGKDLLFDRGKYIMVMSVGDQSRRAGPPASLLLTMSTTYIDTPSQTATG